MAAVKHKIRLIDTIDLTGEDPVIKKKCVEESITVVNLESENFKGEIQIQNTNSKKVQCEVCLKQDSKYTCPACKMKTCCLFCSKKHKNIKNCSGEREKVKYVARSDFNDMHLLNDLRFLEDVKRLVDNAHRDSKSKPNRRISKKLHLLQKAVKNRDCKLFRMAKGMQRWKENKTFYNVKEDALHWTIKFVFEEIYETVIVRHSEKETFKDILSPFIDKERVLPENKLKFFEYTNCQLDKKILLFFKHELEQGQDNKRFTEVNIDSTVKESLKNMSILEYPEYKVVLSSNAGRIRNQLFTQDNLLNVKKESDESSSDSSSDEEISKKTLEDVLRDMNSNKLFLKSENIL
ncbi:box C/D snoRNA protein 1 isoform X2 [Hydra vulgaris]|uniref:Box C/D snoRNA protein 1 isoform X2 n=1 Tax=Hydra vulgaris TaxID=6087 RepID=A0ABM4CVI5_HYDVU